MLDISWKLFELAVTIFEAFIVTHFVFSYHKYRWEIAKNKRIYFFCTLPLILLVIIIDDLTVYEGLLGVVYILYLFFISFVFLKGKILEHLFSSVIPVLAVLGINAVASGVLSAVFKTDVMDIYTEQNIIRFLTVLAVQVLLALTLDIILRVTRRNYIQLYKREWHLIFAVLVISFITIVLIQMTLLSGEQSTSSKMLLLGAEVCVVILVIVCFYMTLSLSKSYKASEELNMLKQQREFEIQNIENVKEQYNEIRTIRHDMKQAYSVIAGLITDGKATEALSYIDGNTKRLNSIETFIDIGNDFVNSILNSKLSSAKAERIKIICSADKNLSEIDSIDLCTLLGNMLDNAVEGSVKCEPQERFIEVDIKTYGRQCIITISNSVACDVLTKNKNLSTTKKDKNLHGFGLDSIKRISEKYDGNVRYWQNGNTFNCEVILLKKILVNS